MDFNEHIYFYLKFINSKWNIRKNKLQKHSILLIIRHSVVPFIYNVNVIYAPCVRVILILCNYRDGNKTNKDR